MFKKIFFTLIIAITLANHSAVAMEYTENNFEEKKPAALTVSRIKEIYKNPLFLEQGPNKEEIYKDAEFSDERSDKVIKRRFKLSCQEKNMNLVKAIDDTKVIPGIWSSMEEGWLFQFILKDEKGMPIFTKEKKVSGILFLIKEIK